MTGPRERFSPSRDTGFSDREILVKEICEAEYGRRYSFEDLALILQVGVSTPITIPRIRAAVNAANRVLLARHQRMLKSVRKFGYRVLEPREHLLAADGHRDKARRALNQSARVLSGTNTDHLTPEERAEVQSQQLLIGGLIGQVRAATTRREATRAALESALPRPVQR